MYRTIKKSANSATALSFAHFFIIHASEKGNRVVLLDGNHYMNKTKNLPLGGSKIKKTFPDITLVLACCYD